MVEMRGVEPLCSKLFRNTIYSLVYFSLDRHKKANKLVEQQIEILHHTIIDGSLAIPVIAAHSLITILSFCSDLCQGYAARAKPTFWVSLSFLITLV